MPASSFQFSTAAVTQASGVQTLPVSGNFQFFQLSVAATGATGTLAVKYGVSGKFYDLLDPATNLPLSINLASVNGAYPFRGMIDSLQITPTSVVGNYVAELRGIE